MKSEDVLLKIEANTKPLVNAFAKLGESMTEMGLAFSAFTGVYRKHNSRYERFNRWTRNKTTIQKLWMLLAFVAGAIIWTCCSGAIIITIIKQLNS